MSDLRQGEKIYKQTLDATSEHLTSEARDTQN